MLLKLRFPEKSVFLFLSRVQLSLFTWTVHAPVPQKAEAGPRSYREDVIGETDEQRPTLPTN